MASETIDGRVRTVLRALCVALIAVSVWRVAEIAPDWYAGRPPAYPEQFMSRLLFAVQMTALAAAVLLGSGRLGATVPGRRLVSGMLAVGLTAALASDHLR